MKPKEIQKGMRFERLLFTGNIENVPSKGNYFECICDCGNKKFFHGAFPAF